MSEHSKDDKISIESIDIDPQIKALLPTYLGRRVSDVAMIAELLEAGDYLAIRRLGHNLRGSGAAYGFPEISYFGTNLEIAAQDSDHETVWKWTLLLQAFVKRFNLADPSNET